jgi:hypothetical protein
LNKLFLNTLVLFINLHFHGFINAQTIQQEKMKDLSFMAGDWVGTSKSIAEQETHSIPAYQNIQYKIHNIISFNLFSKRLLLHTVIYYDEKEDTYYYSPYFKTGASTHRGKVYDNKFWVYFSDTKAYVAVVDEKDTVRQVSVLVGHGVDDWIAVNDDLKAGDKVIVRGGERLKTGNSTNRCMSCFAS